MPAFILLCRDYKGGLDARMAARADHLAYIAKQTNVLLAGPILDDDENPIGSMLLIEAADKTAARAFAEGDPYGKRGVFESVEIKPINLVTGSLCPK